MQGRPPEVASYLIESLFHNTPNPSFDYANSWAQMVRNVLAYGWEDAEEIEFEKRWFESLLPRATARSGRRTPRWRGPSRGDPRVLLDDQRRRNDLCRPVSDCGARVPRRGAAAPRHPSSPASSIVAELLDQCSSWRAEVGIMPRSERVMSLTHSWSVPRPDR